MCSGDSTATDRMSQDPIVSADRRVLNVTRNFRLKRNQALKAVENCACAWVKYGVTIRDLTLAESISKRHEQASMREPLPLAELHGLIFQSPTSQHYDLIAQANRYCAEYAGSN